MKRKSGIEYDLVWKGISGLAGLVALPFKRWLPGLFAKPSDTSQIVHSWKEVLQLKNQGDVEHLKSALVQADKTLDHALRMIAAGQTMGDRLKAAKERFSHTAYQRAWDGHKVRNQMVHELNHGLEATELRRAVDDIEAALRDIKMLP